MNVSGTPAAQASTVRVRVPCVAPYNWQSVLAFFRVRAVPGLETCSASHYARTVIIGEHPGLLTVHATASGRNLHADICAPAAVDKRCVRQRLQAMFDTGADLQSINAVLDADARLKRANREPSGLRVAGTWDRFELIIRAILGQQVTVAAGRTFSQRLCESFGAAAPPACSPSHGLSRLFPAPSALADADIARIGLPARRAQTLRAVSRAVTSGAITTHADGDWDDLEAGLLEIAGIGPWTAGYVRMRACKDPDAFPAADVALLNAARRLEIADCHKTLLTAAERWRPWRAYAAVRLWQSL